MSTFTDSWNGPGGCGPKATLPQVKTLEELLAEIAALTLKIEGVKKDLTTHEGLAVPTSQTVHGIMAELKSRLESINTSIKDEVTDRKDADTALDDRIDGVINNDGSINPKGTVALYATAKADDALASAQTDATSKADAAKAYALGLTQAIDTTIANLKNVVETDKIRTHTPGVALVIDNFVRVLEGIRGPLYPNHKIDFKNFAYIQCPNVTIMGIDTLYTELLPLVTAGSVPNQAIAIVGYLSDEYDNRDAGDPDNVTPFIEENTAHNAKGTVHKAARVFLKFSDSDNWNAIIDMVFNKDSVTVPANPVYAGAIGGSVAKSTNREYLGFGLYRGTGVTDGREHIYLGIKVKDILTWQSQQAYVQYVGFHLRVAGVNFIPVNPQNAPEGGVNEIPDATISFITNRGGTVFNKVTVQTIYTNNFRDLGGHGVALVDEVADILRIGAPDDLNDPDAPNNNHTHAMELYSKTRPDVFIGEGGAMPMARYHLAFLEDLAQSIYFQRDVIIAVDYYQKPGGSTGSDLSDLKVWQLAGVVVQPNTPNATKVDGFYTMDPLGNTTAGHIFAAGDTILIKAGSTSEAVPDGYVNKTLTANAAQDVDISLFTGMSDIIVGATVADPTGTIGKVLDIQGTTVRVTTAGPPATFSYTLPAYVVYTVDGYGPATPIPLPKSTPGNYLHDVSYEWAGSTGPFERGEPDSAYYQPGYEIWTPQHENPVWDPEATGDPNAAWSRVHIDLDGYRSSARQDQIDGSLKAFATVQSDYGEMEQLAKWQLPEGDNPTVANPAYIHNKPWTGLAVLDGGEFGAVPLGYAAWLVDGGDFTDFDTTVPGYVTPPVSGDNQFRNVIIRLWHGDYDAMPEIISPVEATWQNFARTLRWVDDEKSLYYSDGAALYEFKSGDPLVKTYTASYMAKSEFFHEQDGGGYRYTTSDHVVFGGANYGATGDNMWYEIYAIRSVDSIGMRMIFTDLTAYLTKGQGTRTFTDADEIVVKKELDIRVPVPPTADGKYKLTVTMASGVPTYAWEADV